MTFDDCAELGELVRLSAKGKLAAFDRLFEVTAPTVLAQIRETGATDVERELERIYLSLWHVLAQSAESDDPSLWLASTLHKLTNPD